MSELADALVRQVSELGARAEKAERERDQARDDAKAKAGEVAHLQSLLAQVRGERDEAREALARIPPRTCGARDDETMREFVSRMVLDYDGRIKELEARVPRCPLCESSDGGHQNGCRWKR